MVDGARRDAVQNRARLLEAARRVFRDAGPDVPLERIAAEAGVSRTTLHRHFVDRDALVAELFAANVDEIEREAERAADAPEGVARLFHFALRLQLQLPGSARVTSRSDVPRFATLADRVEAAFLVAGSAAPGSGLHPGVELADLMIAFPMADAAVVEDRAASRPIDVARVHLFLHRALFARPWSSLDAGVDR